MLSREQNALLTQTDAGTPMGALFRRFWLPALLSEELAEADGAPVRVRLLGEDLVAFRATDGSVGLVGDHCPHRGASLFFGRNEEGGLRCVYHGWKFGVQGNCVDMPNEPPESNFKDKIRHTAYPTVERGGLVWTYMGPPDLRPAFPELEWARVPAGQRYATKYLLDCNYMQAMEGDLDSSHLSFLHSTIDPDDNWLATNPVFGQPLVNNVWRDRVPRFTVLETEAGLTFAARRNGGPEDYYWRITQWLMPTFSLIPTDEPGAMQCNARVPRDDGSSWFFRIRWRGEAPLSAEEVAEYRRGGSLYGEHIPGTWRSKANRDNDYLIDRDLQRRESFTGITSIPAQDMAMIESMGPVYDRSREHLGTSDTCIIATRRRLLAAARDVQDGRELACLRDGMLYHVRATTRKLPHGVDFQQALAEAMVARS